MKRPLYLDYAATTPIDERVAEKMAAFLTREGQFGNAASAHFYGQEARRAVEIAREQTAAFIHAEPSEIIFSSGATESNNLALKGCAALYHRKGKHIITMKTEHKAVLDVCQYLEKEGFDLTYLTPETNGLLDIEKLKSALRPDTILVSIMHVNNETGVIQPLDAIAEITKAAGALFHTDAAQSAGKVPLDVGRTPIDLLSLCAHKAYGPKGIGALYLRKKPRVRVMPLIHGGGHEQGMRSGTLAVHQIVGMGEALQIAEEKRVSEGQWTTQLRDRFLQGLQKNPALMQRLKLNVPLKNTVPHIMNVRFEGMIADALLAQLPVIAASTASACQGKGTEGSYVLRAMGFTDEQIKSAIRFSFGRYITMQEIDEAAAAICELSW